MIIRIDYQEPDVMLDLWGGTSGTFSGLDRFGRILDQRWLSYSGSPADLDRYKYGYDRNSNRTWKENTVSKSLGTPVYLDEFYTYDNLNRLTSMQRGQLTGTPPTGISGTPAKEQDWTLDKTGNWSNFTTKTTGTTDLNQTRTSNTVNELTGFTTSTGTAWATPEYDAAGNTITMPQPNNLGSSYTAVYDAWNRMVSISDSSNTVAQYQYDGRGRRAVKLTFTGGTLSETRHFYWSNGWQDLEERTGTSTTADKQYVWGVRYVDELICRDDAAPARYYALQDANFNLTAIADTSGAVQERYVFDPYGYRRVRDITWSTITSSAFAWTIAHQGLLLDTETELLANRNRVRHPLLGGFLQRDPVGYRDGTNLVALLASAPLTTIDPAGLDVFPVNKAVVYRLAGLPSVTLDLVQDLCIYYAKTIDGKCWIFPTLVGTLTITLPLTRWYFVQELESPAPEIIGGATIVGIGVTIMGTVEIPVVNYLSAVAGIVLGLLSLFANELFPGEVVGEGWIQDKRMFETTFVYEVHFLGPGAGRLWDDCPCSPQNEGKFNTVCD